MQAMGRNSLCFFAFVVMSLYSGAQQLIPPGQFAIDGIPVSCGTTWTVLDPSLNDAGHWDGANYIRLNPYIFFNTTPTTEMRLFIYAHECGHVMGNLSEVAADCWAVRLGKQQGWFSAQDFPIMGATFQNNPGDYTHPPGPMRVQLMMQCFMQAP